MDRKYICYCGLYCEHCSVKAKIGPAAKLLHEEMKKAGFEEVIHFIPGGDGFWPFLEGMAVRNALLREKGMDAWAKLQDERREKGFTYADESVK